MLTWLFPGFSVKIGESDVSLLQLLLRHALLREPRQAVRSEAGGILKHIWFGLVRLMRYMPFVKDGGQRYLPQATVSFLL